MNTVTNASPELLSPQELPPNDDTKTDAAPLAPSRRSNGKRLFVGLFTVTLGLALVWVLRFSADSAAPSISTDASSTDVISTVPAPAALAVRPVMAAEAHWPLTLNAVGSIAAWQEVVIGAEIGGQRLARLLVDIGDEVHEGQLLAELSKGTLEAQLNASRAALREAEVAAADERRTAARMQALKNTVALSAQEIDRAVAAAEAAQARLLAARAQVEADTLRLAYTEVRAPDDGIISARTAVEGTLIQPGAEILRLQRQGRLEWRAELSGLDLIHVVPGQAVRIALTHAQFVEGRVRNVSPQVDPQSRTGIVYVDLDLNAHVRAGQVSAGQVRAGLFARGEIRLDERPVLTLPESAVLLRDGFSYVFRLEGDTVRQQKVTLGARRDGRVEVRDGLTPGTAVVESGVAFLSDGVTVRVVTDTPSSAAPLSTASSNPAIQTPHSKQGAR